MGRRVPPLVLMDEGVVAPARPRLDVTGAGVTLTDDPANNKSVLNIPNSAGGWSVSQSQFDPMSYSAAGDGTTNDLTALQNCVADAKAVTGRVNVHKPHRISGGSITADRGVTIAGVGMAPIPDGIGYMPKGRIIQATDHDVFAFTGRAAADVGFHVLDLGITTPEVAAANFAARRSAASGVRIRDAVASRVERCTIFGFNDSITVDGSLTSWFHTVRDCELGISTRSGIHVVKAGTFGSQLGDLRVSGCQITNANLTRGTGAGVWVEGCATTTIADTDSIGWVNAVRIAGISSYNFLNAVSCDTSNKGIVLSGAGVLGTLITDCYSADNGGGSHGISIEGAQWTTIRGGMHGGYLPVGIGVDAAARNTEISEVQFWTWNGFGGAPSAGPTNAISLAAGASKFQIHHNRAPGGCAILLGGYHTYGIIEPNNTGMTISGSTAGTGNSMANGPY